MQKELKAQQLDDFVIRQAAEKRAHLILIAEYDRRFGLNAWAALGKEFPESIAFYTRSQLADKAYELRYGHPRPKARWIALFWVAATVAYFVYGERKDPEHGFWFAATVLVVAILLAGFLSHAFEDFYPLRECKLDKLIVWHAKSPLFILFLCVLAGAALILGGTRGLGWLLVAAAAAYATCYCLLGVAGVVQRVWEIFDPRGL